jgi:hypothetical protein
VVDGEIVGHGGRLPVDDGGNPGKESVPSAISSTDRGCRVVPKGPNRHSIEAMCDWLAAT